MPSKTAQRSLCVQEKPLDVLIPYARNPRKNQAVDKVAASIQEFGWQQPIVVDADNVIIVGHTRYQAAQKLGLKTVPVIVAESLTPEQVKAYRIADNRTAEDAHWDEDLLALEIGELEAVNYDMGFTGLDTEDLERVLSHGLSSVRENLSPVEEDPLVVPAEAITKTGDFYQIGAHFLLCGDSTRKEDFKTLIQEASIDILYTDPPYGISIVPKDGKIGGNSQKYKPIKGDENTAIARQAFHLAQYFGIKNMILWGGNYFTDFLPPSPCWLIWDKERAEGTDFADCEAAWTSFPSPMKIFRHQWDGFRRASEKGESRVHPPQKPVALAQWCLSQVAERMDTVLDLFAGSGSTMVACENLNKKCFAMEFDSHYCDVIVKRMATLFPDLPITRNGEPFGV